MINVRANTKTSARNKINKRKYVIKYTSQNNQEETKMVNGWKKKGKYLYENSITKWWIGIKKRKITQLDDFDRLNGKWIKNSNLWNLKVKRPNGDIEYGVTANTQADIFKKAISYMRKYPSKTYQFNVKSKKKVK